MNPRAEAVERLDGRYDARVLEPSPPAVEQPPWFADDPVGRGDPPAGLPRVSPVSGADLRWDDLITADAALARWCSDRWLGAHRRLDAAPAGLVATRESLHRLAERVISPARERVNGKIGLRFTRGGFGTPFFGDDAQVRVCADELIVQSRGEQRSAPITTLAAAAAHLGDDLLPDQVDEAPLAVDRAAAAFLGNWFGFGAAVLEELRARAHDELEPSRVQLWPEHFDIAVELGSESAGARAGYGASPGDELHPEPYLYVVPWGEPAGDEALWQASAFRGAELPFQALHGANPTSGAMQRELALEFFAERLHALTGA